MSGWLTVRRGEAPLVVSIPHTGVNIPPDLENRLVSPWLARKDADWWVDNLYDFAGDIGATTVHTAISRTVIDVNRDPAGQSLYPGQATTGLCPITTFDGEPLYQPGQEPDAAEIAERRSQYFEPYHAALAEEIARLRENHRCVVLYDCHSIRSIVPRLFEGGLPNFNIGTNSGRSCDAALTDLIDGICAKTRFSRVVNGRFAGGWITRHYGEPGNGVHAVQMELACRGYMNEPLGAVSADTWPTPYDETVAAPMRAVLIDILKACIDFANAARTAS
ncbi:MAG: N-formylglutamate deformylase [Xanthobacteraceae bacterium]